MLNRAKPSGSSATAGPRVRALWRCGGSVGALTVGLLAASFGPARAEEVAPGAQSQGAGPSIVEGVVVTARKRQELLVNVPVAASTLSNLQLQQYQSNDLTSIGGLLPGVDLQHAGGGTSGAALSIRGVGSLAVDYGN